MNGSLALTDEERLELCELKAVVARTKDSYLEGATALARIRDKQLYRETHRTFREFAADELGMGERQAQRMISAAKVSDELLQDLSGTRPRGRVPDTPGPVLPVTEMQVRELGKAPEEERSEVWEKAVESANGKHPTAKQVAAAVEEAKGETIDQTGALLDAEGNPVPDRCAAAFLKAKELESKCREMDKWIREVRELAVGPAGRLIRFESVKQQAQDAKGNVWNNRPTHLCPYCHGTGDPPDNSKDDKCPGCSGDGWTARHIWVQAPGNSKYAKGEK